MAAPPPRILLSGDVLGRLHLLFKRVQSVSNSAGPFDALLCVGQFFPSSSSSSSDPSDELADFIAGRAAVPLPTYFIGDYGVRNLPAVSGFKTDGIEICRNLYWLKGSGKFALRGLSVVYLSGRAGIYSEDDVDAVRALAEEPGVVDLFLSNEWPAGIAKGADTKEAPAGVAGMEGCDPVVAELVAEIKPRYHIAGTKGIFYAREPYSNSEVVHVTRFIGLAAVGNKDKQKFIHAISPTPASTMSASEIRARPPNTTVSPFMAAQKTNSATETIKRPANSDAQYWRYDVSQKRQRQGGADGERLCFKFTSTGSCPRGEKCNFQHDIEAREQYQRNVCFDFLNKGKCERGSDCKFNHKFIEEGDKSSQGRNVSSNWRSSRKDCWFCLSSPNVESHLILSVGESYYCALAKGPLVRDHVLVIPIEHHTKTLNMVSEAEAEVATYKNALTKYFKNQRKTVVFFEWIFQHNHANLQVQILAATSFLQSKCQFELIVYLTSKKVKLQKKNYKSSLFENVGISMIDIRARLGAAIGRVCFTIWTICGNLCFWIVLGSDTTQKYMAIPIPLDKSSDVKRIFDLAAKKLGFEFAVMTPTKNHELKSQFNEDSSLFYVELPDGTTLVYFVYEQETFPVQFGREVLAALLNMPDRGDWRNCKLSKEDEVDMVNTFKKGFEEYDPAR